MRPPVPTVPPGRTARLRTIEHSEELNPDLVDPERAEPLVHDVTVGVTGAAHPERGVQR